MRGHPLVEQAQATLLRLAEAPPAAEAANALHAEIDELWQRPLVAGIGGEVPSRTELFNLACEGKVFDPYARALGSAAVRLRRGATTGFRATREDGSVEEQTQPPDRAKDIAAARARAAAAQGELHERESALVRVDSALPKRPAWWAVWLWPAYWIATWLGRKRRSEHDLAVLAVDEARQKAATIEQDAAAVEAHARLARQRYFESLRNLASGGTLGAGIAEVDVTLASSPLPENVEIIELAGASRAGAEVDAVLLVQGDRVFAPVRGGSPLAVGDHAATLAALPAFLADARALRIARRVQTKIGQATRSLADAIERKEAGFRARLDRLEAMRVTDPVALARRQLDRVRSEISASVNAVVEHSSVHLGSELAQLQQQWIGSIAAAQDKAALEAALAKIEEEWDARPRRIAEEVRVLAMGGLGGTARDLYPAMVEDLVARGLPEAHTRLKMAPELPRVVLLPSLAKEATKLEKPGLLAGLFRSFETRRTEVREKVYQRVERMRELAEAELLDAEPRLHHAIGTALVDLFEAAVAKQQEWLDGALDAERARIGEEREVVTPLVRVHDAVRLASAQLATQIAQLELDQPAIAVAAAAADTASLSR